MVWEAGVWGRMRRRDSQGVWDGHGHTATFNMDHQQGPAVQHRGLCSVLCGSLDVGVVEGRMDTCIRVAESLHCVPEAITTLLIGHAADLSCFGRVRLCTLSTVPCQAPLPMGLSKEENWSGLPCSPPRHLPNPGIESGSLASQTDSLPLSHQGGPLIRRYKRKLKKKCCLIKHLCCFRYSEAIIYPEYSRKVQKLLQLCTFNSELFWI